MMLYWKNIFALYLYLHIFVCSLQVSEYGIFASQWFPIHYVRKQKERTCSESRKPLASEDVSIEICTPMDIRCHR